MNAWKTFADLVGTTERTICKILSMSASTGKATVEVYTTAALDEEVVVSGALSTLNVGDFVFVEDGVIISKAPVVRGATEVDIQ